MPRCKERPWERQPDESAPAFEAFSLYRDMGAERSTAKVALALGKTKTLTDRWSSRWSWVYRAREYDRHLDAEKQKEAIKEAQRMSDRHIRLAMKLQETALKALNKIGEDDKMNPQTIMNIIDKATAIERKTRIGETGPFGQRAPGLPRPPEDSDEEPEVDLHAIRKKMDEMSDEQLAQYEQLCSMFRTAAMPGGDT